MLNLLVGRACNKPFCKTTFNGACRKFRLMLNIHCFLDDSGKESQPSNPFVCMAGYFGSEEAIKDLNSKWLQLLKKYEITEVHMKELIPLEGEYKKWALDKIKRDLALDEFIRVTRETHLVGIGVAIDTAAWKLHRKRHPKEHLGTAQQFALVRILSRLIDHLRAVGNETSLSLVFDTDPEFGSNRLGMFDYLMTIDTQARKRLSSITFARTCFYPGLQCADMLVWETRREMIRRSNGQKSTRRWDAMLAKMPEYELEHIGEMWDDRAFIEIGRELLRPAYEQTAAFQGWLAARARS